MVKVLTLLFVLLVLSECSTPSTSAPTNVTPIVATHVQRDLATPAPISAPTATPLTAPAIAPAQPSTIPPERPTALPPLLPSPTASGAAIIPSFSYPIGMPGKPLGDGFFIRDGAQVENTWYNPGYWHTGEDWYTMRGDTAGARVYAVTDGEVVYAGANYPGRVVIVRHAPDLYSMYGHLDPSLKVQVGQQIKRGDILGTVLRRGDKTPNHLHFEIRTFLTAREVNGDTPRYSFRCGVNCPPGPGYWPMNAPDLPSDLGWRIPTHVMAQRMFPSDAGGQLGEVVVATQPISSSVSLWSASPDQGTREAVGELELHPGERFR